MTVIRLDALASFLSFLGGCVLTADALRARIRARIKVGESFWKSLPRNQGKPDAGDYDYWAANLSFWFALLGLALISAGFLIDFLIKTGATNPTLLTLS